MTESTTSPDSQFSVDEARRLVTTLHDLVALTQRALPTQDAPVIRRLREHLAVDDVLPNSSIELEPFERANLQVGLDALEVRAGTWELFGLPSHIVRYADVALVSIAAGAYHGPPLVGPPQYLAVPSGPHSTVRCLRDGIIVIEFDGEPLAVMLTESQRGPRPKITVEVIGASQAAVDGLIAALRAEMERHNVMRGQIVSFTFGEYGGFGLDFVTLPAVARHEVILPDRDLAAIERHALGMTGAADALVGAGQHLRRGMLLYGPPGTGKTHTVAYLVGAMAGRTTVLLSGASVEAIGQAGAIARSLAPATIVVEDVDLIGMDRSLPGGEHNPLLFQLLNEMDGLGDDLDVLFLLTTNRVDLLEPALAARPGRVDQAVEIGLPDAEARRALFELYLPEPVDTAVLDTAVERTAGAAAAFIRELARRTVLARELGSASLEDALTTVVTEMLDTASPLLRTALAAPND